MNEHISRIFDTAAIYPGFSTQTARFCSRKILFMAERHYRGIASNFRVIGENIYLAIYFHSTIFDLDPTVLGC